MESRTYSAYNDTRIELEPLRSCNAYIRHHYSTRTGSILYSELVSYCTPVCSYDYLWQCIDVMPAAFCSPTTARQVTWFMAHMGLGYSSSQLKLYLTQAQKAAKTLNVGASYDFAAHVVTPLKHLPCEVSNSVEFPSRYKFNNGYKNITPYTPFSADYRASIRRG